MSARDTQWSVEPDYEAELRVLCHCGHRLGSHIECARAQLAHLDWEIIDLRCTNFSCRCSDPSSGTA